MSDKFDNAFNHVVASEGGFANLKGDPGGRTMYGITERDHPDLWQPGPPTLEQAKARYRERYWDACRCELMPWPLCWLVFDAAVNQGNGPAVSMLQKVLRLAQDGIPGKDTIAAVNRADMRDLLPRYMAVRGLRYFGTRNFDKFGEGWLWRLFSIMREV